MLAMGSSNDPNARAPGSEAWREVLASALDVKDAAEALGVSAATVHQMVCSGELVAVRVGGVWRLPAWQFGADGLLPGVGDVVQRWPGSFVLLSIWACTPSGELRGRTPTEALKDSDLFDVTATLSGRTSLRGSIPPE